MATLYKPDGSTETVEPKNGTDFQFEGEAYLLLDTDIIEVVSLADGRIMLIDEEGKLKPRERNRAASVLLQQAGGIPGDYIVGNALVIDENQLR